MMKKLISKLCMIVLFYINITPILSDENDIKNSTNGSNQITNKKESNQIFELKISLDYYFSHNF
jgi:hypothetical protein